MVEFPQKTRMASIRLSTVRLNLLGGVGNYAQVALCDEQGRPMSMTMTQKFSDRTYELIEALATSIEQDVYDTFAQPDGGEDMGVSFE
jgi:hypothetical protein